MLDAALLKRGVLFPGDRSGEGENPWITVEPVAGNQRSWRPRTFVLNADPNDSAKNGGGRRVTLFSEERMRGSLRESTSA